MEFDLVAERRERRLGQAATIDSDRVVPISEGVIEADHSFAVRAVNHAAADLLGWEHPVALTRDLNASSWSLLGPDLRREVQMALVTRGRWEGCTSLRRRDGSMLETYLTACILHGSPGVPTGIVATFRPLRSIPDQGRDHSQGDLHGVRGLPGHFCLYYQPEVDLRTGAVTSAEALLRWWHPGMGVVSPGPALSNRRWAPRLAELEVWSVFAVCRQSARWREEGHPLPVSLNLSRNHVEDEEVVDRIRRAIVVTGLEPGDLTVDLPASALMRSPERARRVAGDLSEIGVAIAIDDVTRVVHPDAFAGIDVDAVKIARSPKRGATPATIGEEATGAVIEVARTLGAASVAKAVETAEERELLERLGCDRAFGHLFLPPLPPRDLAQELWPATPAAPISPSPRRDHRVVLDLVVP